MPRFKVGDQVKIIDTWFTKDIGKQGKIVDTAHHRETGCAGTLEYFIVGVPNDNGKIENKYYTDWQIEAAQTH